MKNESIYFLCPNPVDWPADQETQFNLNRLGLNTGNLAFIQGVVNIFDRSTYSDDSFLGFFNRNKKYNIKSGSTVVIPLANHLDPLRNIEFLGDFFVFLKQKDIKYIILGLGSQFSVSESPESAVKKLFKNNGFKKFLDGLLGASYITVRGEFTKELLLSLGVVSESLSCPSIFIDIETKSLGSKIEEKIKILSEIDKPLNFSINTLKDVKLKKMENFTIEEKLYRIPAKNKLYIHQTSHGNGEIPDTGYIENDLKKSKTDVGYNLLKVLGGLDSCHRFQSKVFFSTSDWERCLKNSHIDFNVGMRMHGNMLAIGSGIPGITIPIDMRMKEIINSLKIPFVEAIDIEKSSKLEASDLLKLTKFDGVEFDNNRSYLASRYMDILEKFGIAYNWKLKIISNT